MFVVGAVQEAVSTPAWLDAAIISTPPNAIWIARNQWTEKRNASTLCLAMRRIPLIQNDEKGNQTDPNGERSKARQSPVIGALSGANDLRAGQKTPRPERRNAAGPLERIFRRDV